jgi:hypothetical protein
MPGPGESRTDIGAIVLHCHVRIVELCAGKMTVQRESRIKLDVGAAS